VQKISLNEVGERWHWAFECDGKRHGWLEKKSIGLDSNPDKQ